MGDSYVFHFPNQEFIAPVVQNILSVKNCVLQKKKKRVFTKLLTEKLSRFVEDTKFSFHFRYLSN